MYEIAHIRFVIPDHDLQNLYFSMCYPIGIEFVYKPHLLESCYVGTLMFAAKNLGKTIGILFLSQVAFGLFINFSVMAELFAKPGFHINGAAISTKVGMAAVIALTISSLSIVIASLCNSVFGQSNGLLTKVFLVLAGTNLALTALEYSTVMNLVTFSQNYLAAETQLAKEQLELVRPLFAGARNWSHYLQVTLSGASVFIFYLLLFRGSAVPKVLSAIGMGAALIQMISVTQPFFGNRVVLELLAPIGLVQILMPIYFIIKGIKTKSSVSA